MNAVEIEDAVSKLAEAPFDAATFPFDFLQAFGTNDAALRKLKTGEVNKSDLRDGVGVGVLQKNKNNIHIKICAPGEVAAALAALRSSPATLKHKARFILATDGQTIQAERFDDGEPLACDFKDLPNRFAYFLSLAGISTVKRIDENAFDIRATGRLNKLYVELLKENPDWDTEARRQDLNHFFARLIFCFFAEDTNIFVDSRLFTDTVEKMTERNGSNVHEVLAELFRAMDTRREARAETDIRPYALRFPYVNGNLFSGSTDTPKFNQSARNYLLFVGNLDWKKINPDIFGSMIQAVADDEERGALGMHYTSVPNILKVLNPLFLDDLRAKLDEGGDSPLKLLNLRKRLARVRVFDPACGSGNFLVIAYIEMRKIEAQINERRGDVGRKSDIPISNFRGIEIRHFPAEIARLALIIAEFQCDVLYRGELFARQEFLPLDAANWITCGNALRLDWLTLCPPTGTGVRIESDGLFQEKLDQVEIDFENAGGETYICGNPPYIGSKWQTPDHKSDLANIFEGMIAGWKSLDYVAGWFLKAAQFGKRTESSAAFVSTNSICQGAQVPLLWPIILGLDHEIIFARTSFNWSNLASHNAGVTVVIIGISNRKPAERLIFNEDDVNTPVARSVPSINAYLLAGPQIFVTGVREARNGLSPIADGNGPLDGGHLLLTHDERITFLDGCPESARFMRPFLGSTEIINGYQRWCIWIEDKDLALAQSIPAVASRIAAVLEFRTNAGTRAQTAIRNPHRFAWINQPVREQIAIPKVSSERRQYMTANLFSSETVISNRACIVLDPERFQFAVISSRLHWIWIATVCVRLRTDLSYSGTIGWNNFPVPTLTDESKADLTRSAQEILLAREAHFPATLADMYDPEAMDTKYPDLRAAHDRNDETLERIYIGRRFRNDTERLEKLFELYTQMTGNQAKAKAAGRKKKG